MSTARGLGCASPQPSRSGVCSSVGAPSAAHSRWSGSKNWREMPTPTGGMHTIGGQEELPVIAEASCTLTVKVCPSYGMVDVA